MGDAGELSLVHRPVRAGSAGCVEFPENVVNRPGDPTPISVCR